MNNDTTKMMDVVEEYMVSNHPLSLFNCGNRKTLFSDFADKEFLKDIILLFRYYHYSANNATMVVSGPINSAKMVKILSQKLELLTNFDFEPHLIEFKRK